MQSAARSSAFRAGQIDLSRAAQAAILAWNGRPFVRHQLSVVDFPQVSGF